MKSNIENKALLLREKGFSFKEISEKLGISKSTASLWVRDVILSKKAKNRIHELSVAGRKKGNEVKRKKWEIESDAIKKKVKKYFSDIGHSKINPKIACALLYWGEGTKYEGNSSVSFMNADPKMIKYFLYVFRKSFNLNEKKFRALVHLHEYHDVEKQLKFWSNITKIPVAQFNKSYLKKNTGKNKKENYPGCISIRYCDIRIYEELMFIIKELVKI
ncbi:MAG: hypothetical protein COU40_02980 [Candidatus Moranbacteria bacterium CG10_big_fil_rev_8_21_14_0_10_35_21]|nr:MAG: hypothetical protein COU40_02980 [Candidatus Moranbacteria bacterium CG10_big_fil_rev_8_21_14_0_10_35_21]PJA88708.1 MAG: hypothetical protein CO139_01740 [Candidatus Moranbacteria bacterium CG_4_9_14_3_um_filter_36_9]